MSHKRKILAKTYALGVVKEMGVSRRQSIIGAHIERCCFVMIFQKCSERDFVFR